MNSSTVYITAPNGDRQCFDNHKTASRLLESISEYKSRGLSLDTFSFHSLVALVYKREGVSPEAIVDEFISTDPEVM